MDRMQPPVRTVPHPESRRRHPHRQTRRRRAGAAVLLSVLGVMPVPAVPIAATGTATAQETPEDARKRLDAVETELQARQTRQDDLRKTAGVLESEASTLASRLVALAADIQDAERRATRLETRIADLSTEEQAQRIRLEDSQKTSTHLLAALESLSRRPATLALLRPGEAVRTARSARVMATLMPQIQTQAAGLRTDLARLKDLQRSLSAERFALKDTLDDLSTRRTSLARLRTEKTRAARQSRAEAAFEAARILRLAEEADSLQSLIEKLEREADAARKRAAREAAAAAARRSRPATPAPPTLVRPDAITGQPLSAVRGRLPYPAAGSVSMTFGQRDGAVRSRGIRIRSRAGAQIIAPYEGQILFAGPYRGYGRLLIIAHSGGYHSLLAGLGDLYARTGEWVLTGEPVGAMAVEQPATADEGGLYMELRHAGQAIDPLPWLSRQSASAAP